jgi:hypothetical protein
MNNLEIKKENVFAAYNVADANGKALIAKLFPDQNFSGKITDRVQTFSDVEAISGKKLTKRTDETEDEFAYRQIKLIAEVYNEGTVLDPMNTGQNKYYPWHLIDSSSGVGLAYDVYGRWRSGTGVGVRLCFKSAELAIDAGKKFIDIYSQLKIK